MDIINIDDILTFKVLDQAIYTYPNPVNNEALSIIIFPQAKVESIKIFNLKGRLIEELETNGSQHIMYYPSNALSSGIYFIGYSDVGSNVFNKVTILK